MEENKITLDILIPTYNRIEDLKKNINFLYNYIKKNSYESSVKIIISDNASQDNTYNEIVELCQNNNSLKNIIKLFKQDKNIGLEKNALFTLEKSESDYIMYLGDDDYISENYLKEVIIKLSNNREIGVVIPSFYNILPTGEKLNVGRDLNEKSKIYKKGFYNCLSNSWRGHQLSGIILKREGLLESYKKNKIQNIYPFIYFVGISCLKYKTYHLTKYPIQVTQVEQEKKDWGYGMDGLISDIFDNYIKMNELSYLQKTLLELKLLKVQSWRYFQYKTKVFLAIINIMKSKNTTILTKVLFFILIFCQIIKKIIRKLVK